MARSVDDVKAVPGKIRSGAVELCPRKLRCCSLSCFRSAWPPASAGSCPDRSKAETASSDAPL